MPGYKPADGYRLDQSLVLAFTRTESKFQPAALSPMGARGLMQLMPATAAQMAGGQPSQAQLCDPSYNMYLGQKYLEAAAWQWQAAACCSWRRPTMPAPAT